MFAKLKVYFPFASNEAKRTMAYRMTFFYTAVGKLMMIFVSLYLWKAIYASNSAPVMGGFTYKEMATYIIINIFTDTIMSSMFADQLARDILRGEIANALVKPIDYHGMLFIKSLGNMLINIIVQCIPFIILFTVVGTMKAVTPYQLFFYCVSVFLSYIIMFLFNFCFATLAFYTSYYFGISMAKGALLKFFSGGLIPFTFFSANLRHIFEVLPFASLQYTPVMIYVGKISKEKMVSTLGIQCFWIVVFFVFSKLLWAHAVKRLTVLGG